MSSLRIKVRRAVLAHNPIRKNAHPQGEPLAYCVCGEAIVRVAGVWWHIYRAGPLHKHPKGAKPVAG